MPKKIKDTFERKVLTTIELKYLVMMKQAGYDKVGDFINYLLLTIQRQQDNIAKMQSILSEKENIIDNTSISKEAETNPQTQ